MSAPASWKEALETLGVRDIAFKPAFAKIAGSVTAGLLLSQLHYWSDKGHDPEGWIYKTVEDFERETTLTRFEQEGARKRLKQLKVCEIKLRGVPATLHYRIDWTVLGDLLSSLRKTSKLDCGKPANWIAENQQTNTEITSETTPLSISIKRTSRRSVSLTEFPETFVLDLSGREYFKKQNPGGDPDREFEKFKTHHQAKGSKFKDWTKAWQHWALNSLKFQPTGVARPQSQLFTEPEERPFVAIPILKPRKKTAEELQAEERERHAAWQQGERDRLARLNGHAARNGVS